MPIALCLGGYSVQLPELRSPSVLMTLSDPLDPNSMSREGVYKTYVREGGRDVVAKG